MSKKYRTQILLEEKQYRYLKNCAERQGISLSEALRRIVESQAAYDAETINDGLSKIKGIGEDTQVSGQEHDNVLYTNNE
ncbi:hypothetical protein [Dethiobacter alkaliphilus]|uniref:hypothetical protein n=1 Tax=Dethiobacter alkaliphilus TaxID=427926 RepID=UPI0022276B47|nr:hypothetical protein [Dethiobacter alkaliphilus]MCW3490720.1 hypothetical protein [Dethiobacter alkaliphilus]